MDEEMMDEHLEDSQVVKPNWKITDGKNSQATTGDDQTSEEAS